MNIRFLLVVILLLTAVATTGCSDYQVSPLASAARRGDAAGIADLIRRGASTEEGTGVNNWTPLQHAIDKNQAQAAFALIEAGRANPNLTTTDTTPLMMAARNGQEEIVRGLLKRGADPKEKARSTLPSPPREENAKPPPSQPYSPKRPNSPAKPVSSKPAQGCRRASAPFSLARSKYILWTHRWTHRLPPLGL